jgi:hypothetical protein
MPRGNPNLAAARKGRAKASEALLFIRLTEEYGVTVDSYNVTLSKIYRDEKQNKVIPLGYRYFSSFNGVVSSLRNIGVSEEGIKEYEDRVRNIKTSYDSGRIKIEIPDDFVSDPNPFSPQEDVGVGD